MRIKEKFEIECKRFYLPVVVKGVCPNCGAECETDLRENYISYPIVNTKEIISIYCNNCEDYFEKEVTLRLSIEV